VVNRLRLLHAPLISACGVFARAITLANRTILVLILFVGSMAVLRVHFGGKMGHRILVVNDTVLIRELKIRKCSVIVITNAWLTEVNHRSFNTIS